MLRLLANENMPLDVVNRLRTEGNDVTWIRTSNPGLGDPEVLAMAEKEQRILLTFDKGFGELAFRRRLSATCGIILFRKLAPTPQELAHFISKVLAMRTDWQGHFSDIEKNRLRMTPMP